MLPPDLCSWVEPIIISDSGMLRLQEDDLKQISDHNELYISNCLEEAP